MSDWSFDKIDLGSVDEGGGRATLVPGNHKVKVAEATIKSTKAGNGKYIEVKLANDAGQYVIDRINVVNKNPKAQEIGLSRLKSLLMHGGHATPDKPGDIASLVGLELGVRVEQGESWRDSDGNTRPGGGQPRNSGAYFALDGNVELGESDAPRMSSGSSASAPEGTASTGAMPNDDIPF
jgi:hypothetical protein